VDEEEQAVLWPSEDKYPAFIAVCDDGVLQTYAEFVGVAEPMVEEMLARGLKVSKVDPDLHEMVAWCRANFGNVKSNARAAYAGMVVLSQNPRATPSIEHAIYATACSAGASNPAPGSCSSGKKRPSPPRSRPAKLRLGNSTWMSVTEPHWPQ
jgi:hypothetical protein